MLVVNTFALRSFQGINPDVAFLTLAADKVLGGAIYGADILDVSPPLCMLIYMPAALLAKLVGFEWGIRLWAMAAGVLSLVALWRTMEPALRLPLAITFVGFITLAYPHFFAQREYFALLLCAPYVAGQSPDRRWALVIGLMAGAGFLMKPFFLIPLAIVFALRRKLGVEERAIIAAGLGYAIVLLVFFRAYLFEMVPAAAATYWAIHFPWDVNAFQGLFVLGAAGAVAIVAPPQPAARPYLAAAAGFAIAALLQNKGFFYHFIPAFGFLALFLVATLLLQRRVVAIAAALFLCAQIIYHAAQVGVWLMFGAETSAIRKEVRAEIDRSASYSALAVETGAAFPFAIYTQSRFVGIAISQIFIPAVAAHARGDGQGEPAQAERLALDQALRELRRKPELVIVIPEYVEETRFDLLAWYLTHDAFRDLWQDYRLERTLGPFRLYRRR